MSKRPTPKKRASHAQTYRRYKIFQGNTQKKLSGAAHLTPCAKCKELKRQHAVCPACGDYAGKKMIDMNKKIEKITKVKA